MVAMKMKNSLCIEEPLKLSESDLSKLMLPGIGILRGIVITFTFMISNFFLNQDFKREFPIKFI